MLNSEQQLDAELSEQVGFWNRWNTEHREAGIVQVSIDQAAVIEKWLRRLGRTDLTILEVGCGAGWLCGRLVPFGSVTATDLSHEVLARAAHRNPSVKFIAGDFMTLNFPEAYDVVVSVEVLSHVADQPEFIRKIAGLLRPGGHLMVATQNRPQLERNDIPKPMPGQIWRWVDRHELTRLLSRDFTIRSLTSITPQFNCGVLRRINGPRVRKGLTSLGLGFVWRALQKVEEKAGLGWTLMCDAETPIAAAHPAS